MLKIRSSKVKLIKVTLVASMPLVLVGILLTQPRPTAQADSGGLSFAQIATHPNASQSGYANGSQGCTEAFCPAGQDIVDMEFTSDGKLITGYGDWGLNSDSWGVPAGRVGVVPYDLQAGTWGTITHTGTEANDIIRTFSDGKQYLPTTDPSIHGSGGYTTNATGSWVVHNVVPAAVHVFDIAERVPGELWLFGSSSINGNYEATAWRSTDNGANWAIAYPDSNVPHPIGNGHMRFYWGAALDGKVYMQGSNNAPVSIFDGTDWESVAATNQVCSASSNDFDIFESKIVCNGGVNDSGINEIAVMPPPPDAGYYIEDLYTANDGYAYILASKGSNSNGSDSKIYRFQHLGDSFEKIAINVPNAVSLAIRNDKVYLGGHEGKIYESTVTIAAMPEFPLPVAGACFNFDTDSGTILDYYDNQNNNPSDPACPRDIVIPSEIGGISVTSIGDGAFISNQLNSVTIPDSVTSIGIAAFQGNQLNSVTIPNSVTSIGISAFAYNQLTSVTIPDSVTSIGNGAFQGNQLTSVTFEGEVATFGTDIFGNNPVGSITYNGTTYAQNETTSEQCFGFENGTITNYYIFDMNLIKDSGIACMSRNVTMPTTVGGEVVASIGSEAFVFNQLVSVTIPDSVTSIGDGAFSSNQLNSVVIPNSVTSIGISAFAYNQLTSVTIPGSVTIVGDSTFQNNQLNSVVIPDSVTSIGNAAFQNNQLTSVTIPNSVTSIGDYAFQNNQLTSVTIPNSVTSIGDYAYQSNQLASVTIPNSVTSIGIRVFAYNQLTSVTIPNSVTSIGNEAFASNQLVSVTIPDSVTSIGNAAFQNNQLTTLTIGNSVTSIGDYAFQSNPVTSIIFEGLITTFGSGFIDGNLVNSIIYDGINYNASDPTPEQCFITASGAITGYRLLDMNDIKDNGLACFPVQGELTIPNTVSGEIVTSIGDYIFYSKQLTSVTIPDSVISIGDYAFFNNQLTTLTIGNSVTTVGNNAFGYNRITAVTLPSSVVSLAAGAFASQSSLANFQTLFDSSDLSEVQRAINSIFYTSVYTANPSNPAGLASAASFSVAELYGDNDYDDPYVIGGHLINPAQLTTKYVNQQGDSLRPSDTTVGKDGSKLLTNYLAASGPELPQPALYYAPTPEEQAAISAALDAAYYNIGDSADSSAPSILGFRLLSAPTYTSLLAAAAISYSYVYEGILGFIPGVPNSGAGQVIGLGVVVGLGFITLAVCATLAFHQLRRVMTL